MGQHLELKILLNRKYKSLFATPSFHQTIFFLSIVVFNQELMIKDSGFGLKITKILGFRLKKIQSRVVSFISKSP
jgi:hypothetical protein